MARTNFKAGYTRLTEDWLNTVDRSLREGVGFRSTPEEVRNFIGAAKAPIADSHYANTQDPHKDSNFVFGGLALRVVSELPWFPFPDVLYLLGKVFTYAPVRGFIGTNPIARIIDLFSDPDSTLLSVHSPELFYGVSGVWEDFTQSGVPSDGVITGETVKGTVNPCQQLIEANTTEVEVSACYAAENKVNNGVILCASGTSPGPISKGILCKLAFDTGLNRYYLRLFDLVSGTTTKIFELEINTAIYEAAYRMTTRLEGNTLYCKIEDRQGRALVDVLTDITAIGPFTGTKHGLWLSTVDGSEMDNFGIWAQRGGGEWAYL